MAIATAGHGYLGSELSSSSADSQPCATGQLEGRDDLSSDTVFRLQILGKRDWDRSKIDESKVEQLVREAFKIDPDTKIILKSLSEHPVRKSLVGTLNFSQIPTKISKTSRSLQEFNETVEDISLDLDIHFHGFTPLHFRTDTEHIYDLIALSGLGGHAFGSFKSRGGEFMWLRDDLPFSVPDARIFIYGYDTTLHDSTSFQSLIDLGSAFKDALRSLLKENWNSNVLKPLVLLGHSLGGLIIKEALCQIYPNWDDVDYDNNDDDDDLALLKSIEGILFFGTPSQGMDVTSLIPMVEGNPNENFLRSLGNESPQLEQQTEKWSKTFDVSESAIISEKLKIISYYETCTSRTAVKVDGKWKMSGPPAKLVGKSSATHGHVWSKRNHVVQPIDRAHSELVKFRSRNDPVYVNHVLPRLQSSLAGMLRFTNIEQNAFLSSLDYPDRTSRLDQITTARENTCKWLLEYPTYQDWLQGCKGLLWLEGHPGSGKSTLTQYAVEATINSTSSQSVVLTHFFNGRGPKMQRSALGLVQSLAYQFLGEFSHYWTEIMNKFKEMGSTSSWKLEWLCSFLERRLRQACRSHPIIIFVDALDECEDEDRYFLGDFFADAVRGPVGASLKIFVSCRHYPNLFSEGLRINAEINNGDDIAVFVTSKLQTIPENKRLLLANEIIDNARGSFQWAKIVTIESVKFHRKGRTVIQIQETIRRLPKDMSELYDRLFQDADAEDLHLACRLFHWLCFAKRPLFVRELQHIIMLSPDTSEMSIKALRHRQDFREELGDMLNTIIDVSRGLAEVISETNRVFERSVDPHSQIGSEFVEREDYTQCRLSWTSRVQLIHQTVVEYLLGSGLKTLQGSRHEFSRGRSNYFITRSCLRYIMMDDFAGETKFLKMITDGANTPTSRNALQPYISGFLGSHLVDVDAGGIDQSDFLVRLHWPYDKFSLTNFAIALDREPFIETFLGGDISSIKWSYDTLLQWSAEVGSAGVVKSIIKRKFDRDQRRFLADGGLHCTIPLEAKIWGNQNVFINGYFNVNLRNPSGSALDRAIAKSHDTVVRELMESPIIDPNFQDSMGETPLHHASTSRVVAHLLKHPKINTSLQCHQGKTALFSAVDRDNLEILRMYIEAASECVNMKDWIFEDTPLSHAVTSGKSDAVMLFINHGNCTRETLQHAFDVAQFLQHVQYRISGRPKGRLRRCMQLLVQTGLVIVEQDNGVGSDGY